MECPNCKQPLAIALVAIADSGKRRITVESGYKDRDDLRRADARPVKTRDEDA